MALTYSQYVGDGSTRSFAVTFPYISKSHVKVRVNGAQVQFTWTSTALVQLNEPPVAGAVIDVRRETPNTEALVDFHDGSTLVESDLDLSTMQSLYIAQEALDVLRDKLGVDSDGAINALSRRIKNVVAPEQPQDASNKAYVDATVASIPPLVAAAQGSADTATAQAQIATSAAETATSKAAEASTSAALAATFDPAMFYPKTAFRTDGLGDSPVKYANNGELLGKKFIINGTAQAQGRLEFWADGVDKWIIFRETDGSFKVYNSAIGTAFSIGAASNIADFAKMPSVAGVGLASLLPGFKNVRFITASGNVRPSAGTTKWLGFLVGGANDGGSSSGSNIGVGAAGGAGCMFFATVSDTTDYAVVIGGKGGNSSVVVGSTTYTANGNGGIATNGLINLPGAPPSDGTITGRSSTSGQIAIGPTGGDGPFGLGTGGGGGIVSNWTGLVTHNGMAARGYGAGGGAAGGLDGSGVGGAGTPGCLLLLEF